MRILSIHNYYQEPGGEDVVVQTEAALLRERGHTVVEYREHNRRIADMHPVRTAIETVWSQPSRRRLADVLREVSPDVAHFHNTFPLISPSGYYACRAAGVPVVQTLHNFRLGCPKSTYFRRGRVCEDCLGRRLAWPGILHACYRGNRPATAMTAAMTSTHRALGTWKDLVDVYVALTEFARTKHTLAGVPSEKLVVKPNCVHPDPGVGDHRGQYVVVVGRLSAEKGLTTVIEAWRRLPAIRLLVVGDGPLRAELEESVRGSGLSGMVEFLGAQPHETVTRLLQGAVCLVFASECYENFPMAIAEAFACGTPVIASRLGAMLEIVAQERTGLLFTPGQPQDLAACVAWVLDHSPQLRAMGHQARCEFEAKYTAERGYQSLMQIYARASRASAR